jgi:hypothetical protein
MASCILQILRDGGESTRAPIPPLMPSSHAEQRRVKTLVRSLSVLEEWLEQYEGRTDEVRVRRIRRWREEALEQLGLLLEPGRH